MHQRTLSTLVELEDKDWFANVGKHDSDKVIFLKSWSDAIKCSKRDDWMALCQEAANQYRARIAERDKDRFRLWNQHVRELKAVTVPLVLRKTAAVVKANNLPESFVNMVQWDILHLCLEAEYADIFPAGFFASQAYWYLNGHFPCGWEGDFPKGQLLVF